MEIKFDKPRDQGSKQYQHFLCLCNCRSHISQFECATKFFFNNLIQFTRSFFYAFGLGVVFFLTKYRSFHNVMSQ